MFNRLFFVMSFMVLALFAPKETAASLGCCSETSCCQPSCCGNFILGVDFLWWKPCIGDINFAGTTTSTIIDNSREIDFDYEGLCPDWRPGVRITFDYPDLFCWCKIGLKASYTYVDMEDRHTVHGDDNTLILFHPGLETLNIGSDPIHGKWYSKYQAWDTLLYFDCCCCDCFAISPYVGIAGVIINENLKTSVEITDDQFTTFAGVDWKSDIWGVGLKTGLEFDYYYSKCLTFYSFASGMVLAGEADTKTKHHLRGDPDTELDIKDNTCCTCIPGFEIGVGAQANFCICGYTFSMRAGYEFVEWFNIPKHRIFTGDNLESEIGLSSYGTRTYGFHGPFAGLVLYF